MDDCKSLDDGSIVPDKMDAAAIEMMRKLGTKKGAAKTHYYPLAMVGGCYSQMQLTHSLKPPSSYP